jgi:ATP-dependent exoDNAse (exonuclease V) beta subunit
MSPSTRTPNDHADRTNLRDDLAHSYIVEAAAGTGKTTELVARIVNVLKAGPTTIDEIVAVTFTEKAAGELKLRLREDLETARQAATGGARARLDAALEYLEEARVSTIHGFCADLLRERPVEARVDPQFQVLTDEQASRMYDVAFDAWLQDQLRDPGEGVRRSLRRSARRSFGTEIDEDGPIERLRRAGRSLLDWRDHPAPWRRDPFDRESAIGRMVEQVLAFSDLTANPIWDRDPLYVDTTPARSCASAIRGGLVPLTDLDGLEAALIDLHHNRQFARPHKGGGAGYSRRHTRAAVWDARQQLFDALGEFERRANADLAAVLQIDLQASLDRYHALKAAEGALDFVDLLLEARTLLRDDAEVRRTFRTRLTHLFIDEFQDTDPLQAEILILLSGHPDADATSPVNSEDVRPRPGSLFIVGDPKQSIYRFRRADVGTYQRVCEWLERRGARRAWLTTSFRATPSIQRFVNAAFEPQMTGDTRTLQPKYVPLTPWREANGQPTIVALPVPRPYGARNVTKTAIENSLPDAVGALLHWLFRESGWKVTERSRVTGEPERIDIRPRHVCLLFRRFTSFNDDMTRPYVQALEARDIPHLLVGGKSFHEREEVETVRAALTAVEWPDDELSVFAALRGALFAIGDDLLLEYRHHFKRFQPYQVPEHLTARLAPVGDALTLLRTLHQRRNRRPVADTLGDLLSETRGHVAFALRPGGEQALANVLHIADLARRYEAEGGLSFRGFVDALSEAARRSEAPEAPILEDGSDGVRLMTVHKAKGLEFSVVVLVDITCKLSRDTADRFLDADRHLCALRLAGWAPADLLDHEPLEVERDRHEGHRLAYVAATRARDLLVVPAVGDGPLTDGWVSPLNDAIYPAFDRRRAAADAPGCPAFRRDSVVERPNGDPARADTVQPGAHRFGSGDRAYDVIWWDPSVLNLGDRVPPGVRHEGLIGKDAPRTIVEDTIAAYRAWEADRTLALERGARPSLVIQTATDWAGSDGEELPSDVEVDRVTVDTVQGDERPRPSGARMGALVHAVLGTVALDANRARIQEVVAVHARLLGGSAEESAAAADLVERTLAHGLLARARAAAARGQCRREVPLTYTSSNATLVEGIADLAFEEDGTWVVVDVKTDIDIGRLGLDRYKRQVALYAAAIARATSKPASAALLRV